MSSCLNKITNEFKDLTRNIYNAGGEELELEERQATEAVVNSEEELNENYLLYGASAINEAYKLRNSVILFDGNFSPKMREYKDDGAEKELLALFDAGSLKTEVLFENMQTIKGYSQRNYHEVDETCYKVLEGKYKGVCFAKAYNTKENRDCIVVDISNTNLTNLSKKWQGANISAFEFATKLITTYPGKDIDWYAAAVHYYWLNENQYAIANNDPTAKPYGLLAYIEKIKDRDNIYVAEFFEQNKDKMNNAENCRDIVRLATKHVSKKINIGNKSVNVFLSVAWPDKDNLADNKLIADIAKYLKKQGVNLINVKSIQGEDIDLLKEIKGTMTNCSGVLSLAFGKHNTNITSPYIYIEGTTASNLNLENLVLVPKEVKIEGLLRNVPITKIEKNDEGVFDLENSMRLKIAIDSFIDSIKLRAFGTLEYADYVNDGSEKVDEFVFANRLIKKYDLNPEIVTADKIVFKKPVRVEAIKIEKSGYYSTCDGEVFLNVDDMLIKNIDGKYHSVDNVEFEKIYTKDSSSNFYIKKPIPMMVAKKNKDSVTVFPMHNPKDVYDVKMEDFQETYEPIASHLRNQSLQSMKNVNVINSNLE